jgi:hypothetical protein
MTRPLASRQKFCWWYGVVQWGVGTGVLFCVGDAISRTGLHNFWSEIGRRLLWVPLFMLLGYSFGLTLWWTLQRRQHIVRGFPVACDTTNAIGPEDHQKTEPDKAVGSG